MKTFEQLREETNNSEILEEGLLRKGAGLVYASQSKKHGDAAVRYFSQVSQHLNRHSETVEERLDQVSSAINLLSKGMIEMRNQNGSITSLCLVSVLLNERSKKGR